jgi:hypothetical protein
MRKEISLSILFLVLLCASFVTASAASSTISFGVSQVTVDETDRSDPAYFTIRRTGDLSEPATVVLSPVDGTATGGEFQIFPLTFQFPAGVSEVERTVTALDDWLYEGTEWFSVQLRTTSPDVRVGFPNVMTVFINDTADIPKVRFTAPNRVFMRVEPTAGRQVLASVGIFLTNPSVEPVSVTFNTTDGTATAGVDYFPSTSTVTFAPLEFETKNVAVTILGDDVNESRETFDIHLVNPVGAEVPIPQMPFTIINKTPYAQQTDFDGNGVADFAAYAETTGRWFIGPYGETQIQLGGAPGDVLVPADFTGDGQTDAAFWRPSSGTWYVVRSEDSSYFEVPFGVSGDIPVPADFDADGVADFAVFRPSNGTWYIQRSSDGSFDVVRFGTQGDRPTPADYDGDSKADLAIYRPGIGGGSEWWTRRSSDGAVTVASFGLSSDLTVAADYTGDGKADIAVWRPTTGQWFVLRSEDSSYYIARFSYQWERPAPGDYTGDGRADYARLNYVSHSWNANWGTEWPWNLVGVTADPTVSVPLATVNVH